VVEVPGKITETHRPLLGQFLQHCDLAKFAGWRYSTEALAAMHASAIDFVQQSAAPKTDVDSNDSATANQESQLPPAAKP
jgi:hypothetical protein